MEEHRVSDLLLTTEPPADSLVELVEKGVERQAAGGDAFEPVTLGKQLEKGESSPERGVEELHTAVGGVHGADDQDILRDREIDSALR